MKTSTIVLGVLAGLALADGHWILAALAISFLAGWIELPCACGGNA